MPPRMARPFQTPQPRTKARLAGLLTLIVAGIIAAGTLIPPAPDAAPLPLTDKQLHALAFAALVLPLGWLRPRHALWLAPLALGYGGAIELLQPLVGRSAEWGDLLADAIGIGAGLLPGGTRSAVTR